MWVPPEVVSAAGRDAKNAVRWPRRSCVIRESAVASAKKMVARSISGDPGLIRTRESSFYINSKAGNFEDYLMTDVWNWVHENFPIRPEREAHARALGPRSAEGPAPSSSYGLDRPQNRARRGRVVDGAVLRTGAKRDRQQQHGNAAQAIPNIRHDCTPPQLVLGPSAGPLTNRSMRGDHASENRRMMGAKEPTRSHPHV